METVYVILFKFKLYSILVIYDISQSDITLSH